MKIKKLPEEKVKKINLIIEGIPNPVKGKPWLKVFPCKPKDLFDNPDLINKSVACGVTISGASSISPSLIPFIHSIDLLRRDKEFVDTDRYLLHTSGLGMHVRKEIKKDFEEHHLNEIPDCYLSKSSQII